MRHLALACFLLAPGAALASDCPAAPDHSERIAHLIEDIRAAPNEMQARTISNRMWEIWADAPDEAAQAILDNGMSRRRAWDLLGALSEFDRLVAYCPDYAEGYNQRAFANFLRQDFAAALIDLDRALALSPNHVAAMSGRALTLMGLGRIDEARSVLNQALELNPWLPERGLVAPGGPLEPKGKDI